MELKVGDKIRVKSLEAHLQMPNVFIDDMKRIVIDRGPRKTTIKILWEEEYKHLNMIRTITKVEDSDFNMKIYTIEDPNFTQLFECSIEELIKE
jgi:exopolysaccharide biosynthesis protein